MDEELKKVLQKILKDGALCGWDERECAFTCHLCGGTTTMWNNAAEISHSADCGIHIIRKSVEV